MEKPLFVRVICYVRRVPEVSRFYGIRICIYPDDHGEPHFHAQYAEDEAKVRIRPLGIMEGNLPAKAIGLVFEWTALHENELLEAYHRAQNHQSPGKIEPLK